MGNKNSASQLHTESRLAANKFDKDELFILHATWTDLAERNQGRGIDRDTFLQYFPLSGLLGDRLFCQFDVKGNGLIDFDEFVTALAVCSRGTFDEKIHFIFNMYDTSHDNTVSKEELTTLLNHVPKSVLGINRMTRAASTILRDPNKSSESDSDSVRSGSSDKDSTRTPTKTESTVDLSLAIPDYVDEIDEIDAYTNHPLVDQAFEECDLNHEGRLRYEEFKMWVERTPAIITYFESILPFVGNKQEKLTNSQKGALPIAKTRSMNRLVQDGKQSPRQAPSSINPRRAASTESLLSLAKGPLPSAPVPPRRMSSFQIGVNATTVVDLSDPMANDIDVAEDYCRQLINQALELTQNESLRLSLQQLLDREYGGTIDLPRLTTDDIYRDVVSKEGYLWKRGGKLHLWSKRWYLLSGNCIYYYAHQKDVRPRGVIFVTGCIVEKIRDEASQLKGYYGLELVHQDLSNDEHYKHETRTLFCRSEAERESWVTALQHSAQVIPIEEEYVIGKELGRGRFSTVCDCVHKVTGARYAVKIIEKSSIEPEEKALLRTEIAVLKLVNHPNIIKLQGVFESRSRLYIVMEKLVGGELFERIVGRPRFSEEEAAKLIRPLLESVAYLHDLGIVHRDIKPENVLVGDNLDDIKIADFGLSKMLLPKERMDTACGTLSYVAPEVLTMQGYGQEADMWSVGVIMFLVLCGKLPFDGQTHDDIIRNTIQAELKVNPAVWGRLSPDCQSLIKALLHKNPKERISGRAALRHPFILAHNPRRLSNGLASGDDSSFGSRPRKLSNSESVGLTL